MEESWHKWALFSPKKRGWNKNGRLQKGCCIKVREDLFCVLMERARDNPTQLRKRKSKSGKKWNFWRARTGQYWVTLQSKPSDLWHQRHWCSSTANFFYQSETSVQLILKGNNRSTTFTLLTRGARSCARQKLPLQCLTLQDVKAVPLATQITDPLASIIAALVALTISHRPLCAFKILRVDFQEGKRKGRQRSPKVPSPFLSQAYRLTPTGWASFLTPLVATTELSKFLGKVFSQCNRSFILLLVREHNQVFPPGFAFQRQKHVTMS